MSNNISSLFMQDCQIVSLALELKSEISYIKSAYPELLQHKIMNRVVTISDRIGVLFSNGLTAEQGA